MEEGIYSRPQRTRAGTDLVMVLHGYGSNPERMVDWFDQLPPHATGVALRGPMDVGGHSGWFLLDYFLANDFTQVLSAAQHVFDWQDRHAHGYSSISLLGHSQGMAMATTLHRLRPGTYTAIVGLSGFVLSNELLTLTDTVPAPGAAVPFFWGRDRHDVVINPDALTYTREWLVENTALTSRTYPEMGHGFGADECRDVRNFLKFYLAAKSDE